MADQNLQALIGHIQSARNALKTKGDAPKSNEKTAMAELNAAMLRLKAMEKAFTPK